VPEDAATALHDLAAHLGAGTIQIERVEPESAFASVRSHLGV
jgi:hypothetical protein